MRGDVYVQFYDRRGDPNNRKTTVTLARSTDGGKSFQNYAWSDGSFEGENVFLGDYAWLTAYVQAFEFPGLDELVSPGSGNLQQAEYYVTKLIENKPTAHDYLNAGHIAWCQRRLKDAIDLYRKSWNLRQNNWELFFEALTKDKSYLISNGIDADEFPLMMDELLFSSIL